MSNMAYCRFHNTRQNLQECLSAMADGDELSPAEAKERDRLMLICAEIAEDWAGEIEELREKKHPASPPVAGTPTKED